MTKRIFSASAIGAMFVAMFLMLSMHASAQQLPVLKAVEPGAVVKVSLKDASGKTWTIPGVKDKKAAVVVFWTPQSAECVRQVTKLAREVIATRTDVQVLAITRGKDKDEQSKSEAAAKKGKWPFPVVYDKDLKVARDVFGVLKVPSFYIVDNRTGRVVSSETNTLENKLRNFTFEQLLDRIRAGKPTSIVEGIPVNWDNEGEMRKLIGKKAPNFSVKDMRGNTRSLASFAGKNLLLVFWSPTCPHCRRELPKLQGFYRTDAKRFNAEILAVGSAETEDDKTGGMDFVSAAGLRFPVSFDNSSSINRSYNIQFFPCMFIINTKGVVVEVLGGEHKTPALILRSLLSDAAYMSGKPIK